MAQACLGAALAAIAWLGLRRSVGAAWLDRCAWFDLLLPGGSVLALGAATARPVLSALLLSALLAGLALVDRVKRQVLREPVVFADRAELIEVVRHPRLYLPFAGTGLVVGGALVACAGVAALAWAEPPLPLRTPWRIGLPVLVALAGLALRPVLRRVAARLKCSRDPARDLARLGMFGCFTAHAMLAGAERDQRRRAARDAAPIPPEALTGAPIVVVQAESWFDAGRLHPALAECQPHAARLRAGAVRHGRLAVPAWAANTVRSEFAVLTGLDEPALGLDRFNPYEAFARAPGLPGLVSAARARGYRTVCVHPFDLRFYGRDRVLPLLGFDRLVGPEAFARAPHAGEWVSDAALARVAAALLAEPGPVLVFAITMECHAPYDRDHGDEAPLPPALRGLPEAGMLARWLARLRGTDAALSILAGALRARGDRGWLMAYGDHQPGLPALFDALGLHDPRTDYLIWAAGADACAHRERDLAAHELGAALAALMADAANGENGARGAAA